MNEAKRLAQLAHELQQKGEWAKALETAKQVIEATEPGSLLHLWGQVKAATIAIDTGRVDLAKPHISAFFSASDRPENLLPWMEQARGIAEYQRGRSLAAISWYQQAMKGFAQQGDSAQVAVTSSMLAFNLAKVGHPAMGRTILSDRETFPTDRTYLFDSAKCAILHAEGRHTEAIEIGRKSLSADRKPFDSADAAAIALLVARSLRETGHAKEATALTQTAARFAVRQQWEVVTRLLLNRDQEGGDSFHEAADYRGSSNPLDGASFTTGIA